MTMSLPPSRRNGRRRPPMADINVTPFVDVMLVLLIIFMVTAPLLVSGVPVDLPETRARALDTDSVPKILSIDGDGRVFIGESEVQGEDMAQALADLRASLPAGQQLFLRADATLDYGRVMALMGELNRAGLNRVALVSTAVSGGSSGTQ